MASLGHIAVGLAAGRAHRTARPARWMLGFSLLSLAPDLDVVAFPLGIPYEHAFGHRGATHALLVALLGLSCALVPGPDRLRAGVLGLGVLMSHGLLDAMTTGGLGPALFWPFSEERMFLSWRPIPVAPIGAGLVSARGLRVFAAEALLFSPLLVYGFWPRRRPAEDDA
ncbi:MAG: metal-dependent hydrolase [Sandaracinaceae bacterium]